VICINQQGTTQHKPTMKTEQNQPSQANGAGSTADQEAAETSDQKVVSNPSGNTPDGRTEAQSPPPAVTPGNTQEVHSLKQAAQPDHKSSTDGGSAPNGANGCALAGGAPPQSPHAAVKAPPAKKKRPKKQDNHLSFRCQTEEMDVVEQRMESTGENQSDAVRSIIREYGNRAGNICLSPKTPPEQLEDLLGILGDWRRDFVKAQPRLNIPTPKTDDVRYEQVKEWRAESKRLLSEIPANETVLKAAIGAVTSLTPEKISSFRALIPHIQKWKRNASERNQEEMVHFWSSLLELFDDMGIKPKP
jgi:hypothetical protein